MKEEEGMGAVMIPNVRKILYATDLSDNARYAFTYAVSIAHNYGAGITILHVLEDLSKSISSHLAIYLIGDQWNEIKKRNVDEVVKKIKTRLEKFRQDMSTELASHPFNIDDIRVKVGIPEQEILREAEEGDFDLVVMGTHGQGVFEEAMIGSTARRVVRRSKKPVLVVRLPEGKD
jgi:nucleotide-binding universal stress UspA family protein